MQINVSLLFNKEMKITCFYCPFTKHIIANFYTFNVKLRPLTVAKIVDNIRLFPNLQLFPSVGYTFFQVESLPMIFSPPSPKRPLISLPVFLLNFPPPSWSILLLKNEPSYLLIFPTVFSIPLNCNNDS